MWKPFVIWCSNKDSGVQRIHRRYFCHGLSGDRLGEPSAAIRKRVEAARERQRARFRGTQLMANADAPWKTGGGPAEVRDYCRLDDVPA